MDLIREAISVLGSGTGRQIDLSESDDFTLDLLNGTRDWRERIVEEFVFGAGTHARVRSSYQILISSDRVEQFSPTYGARLARIVLPLATRPKAPLFDLDLHGPAGTPFLIRRRDTSVLEATALSRLLQASPSHDAIVEGLSDDLLYAICAFTPGRFLEVANEYSFSRPLAIAQYLADGLALQEQPTTHQVGAWLDALAPAARTLAAAFDEQPDRDSSSENILLALPEMVSPPETRPEIDATVNAYVDSIRACDPARDGVFLSTLAEYGRRYEVLVDLTVPIGERCTVKLVESRPLNLHRGWAVQRFALGDAQSGHMEARVSDSNVDLGKFRVTEPSFTKRSGRRVGLGQVNSARKTRETLSLYGSDPDRPYYVDVRIKLQLARFIRVGTLLLIALSVAATAGALLVPQDSLYVERLGLLVIPTTLATAVVLAREQSALANELQRRWRLGLTLAIASLWLVMFFELLGFHAPTKHFAGEPSGAIAKLFPADNIGGRNG